MNSTQFLSSCIKRYDLRLNHATYYLFLLSLLLASPSPSPSAQALHQHARANLRRQKLEPEPESGAPASGAKPGETCGVRSWRLEVRIHSAREGDGDGDGERKTESLLWKGSGGKLGENLWPYHCSHFRYCWLMKSSENSHE